MPVVLEVLLLPSEGLIPNSASWSVLVPQLLTKALLQKAGSPLFVSIGSSQALSINFE